MSDIKSFDQISDVAGIAWGVHQPFRDYMQRIPDGQMTARDGAELLASGETYFPLDPTSTTPHELRFRGTLEFIGHHGMMAVTVQEPWLQQLAGDWHLSMVDPFEPTTRMTLVEVEFHDDATTSTRLTEAGTDVFMGNYHDNALFDPVRIVRAEQDQQ